MNARGNDHGGQSSDPWWDYAHGCGKALARGQSPPTQALWGPLLEPGEELRLNAPATYSRLQRGAPADLPHQQTYMPMYPMNPVGMLGMAAMRGIQTRRQRRQSAEDEQLSWRLHRNVDVLTTNQRLMCSGPEGASWLSFWLVDVNEFHPDLANRSLTLGFRGDQCAPVRLEGPAVPAIALWTAHGLHGDQWRNDPRLHALATPSPNLETRPPQQAGTHLGAEAHAWMREHGQRAHSAQQNRTRSSGGRER